MAGAGPETETPTTFADAEAAGEVLAGFVADMEAERYSVQDSLTLVRLFTKVERTAQAGKALAADRVAHGPAHVHSGHRSAAEALAAATGDSVGEVKEAMELGANLADRPRLAASFKQGKLSRRRATLAAKAARVNPTREGDLADSAEQDSEATFKDRCQRAKAEGRTKDDEARHFAKLHQNRSCRTWTTDDGAFCLHAVLTPETGAGVLAALDAQTDRQFLRARDEGRFEGHDAYRADALVALLTARGILGPRGRTPGAPGGSGPATTGTGTDTDTGGTTIEIDTPTERTPDPRATVSVVVDLESLRRGHVGRGGRCDIPGVGPVPVDHARDLLGEALVELLVARGTDVTTVYSAGRHIPKRVRSALLLRDPRCVVPGCDARLGLENDHWVTDFAKGGLTSLDNLARICRGHHRDRTHHGFTLDKVGDTWVWTAPDHPVTPRRPNTRRRARGRTKAPPPDKGPPLFDDRSPPSRE